MEEVKNVTRTSSTSPNSNAGSPINCAICLGPCTNKCVLDSCMHQFCFGCVLKWSKIKAECPLCKQPFTSIIHNIKSINEYDEHVVGPPENSESPYRRDNYLYLPSRPPMTHFQFRTRLTVDLREELEITYFTDNINHRYRRDVSSTAFRRSIYASNLWSSAPPDITGRYRITNPEFYRLNPAAINRLAPWLNRELNALLEENTQQVMMLVDVILTHLREHHIKGRFFRNLLSPYFGAKTSHFIHEFYNFMQSPFDMIGYDRHVLYTHRHIEIVSDIDNSSDSDVQVVESEIIEIRSDTDSDVIIISDSEVQNNGTNIITNNITTPAPLVEEPETSNNNNRKPILPLKIRLKHHRQSREGSHKKSKRRHRRSSSSSSSSSTSSASNHASRKYRRKNISKKRKISNCSSSTTNSSGTIMKTESHPVTTYTDNESSDNEPLLYLKRKLKLKLDAMNSTNSRANSKTKHGKEKYKVKHKYKQEREDNSLDNHDRSNHHSFTPPILNEILDLSTPKIEPEEGPIMPTNFDINNCPGPSNVMNKVKIEKDNKNWYYRPPSFTDSDDE